MTSNNKPREIIREQAAAFALLGNEYEITAVKCTPGDSAVRITKQDSNLTLYVIAYSDPDDIELGLYDENDFTLVQCSIYNGALDKLTAEDFANDIRTLF